ncbi:MAG: WxL domain-containing protein [Kurthia sp.]|nr:WxL domain-containing protein [Candidatus Kurthia equi]
MKIVKLGAMAAILASGVIGMEAKAEETKTYNTNGDITFEQSTEPEQPVYPGDPNPETPVKPTDPTNPDGPGEGTQGPISIDYISSLDFGKQEISNKNQLYYAKPQSYQSGEEDSPNFMQVTDKSGKVAGWRLSVEQVTDFTAQSEDATNKTITGAKITLNAADGEITSNSNSPKPSARNITLDGAGSSQAILSAEAGAGAGLWTSTFGELETTDETVVNTGASLMIPGSSQTDADKYTTELVWKIENVPGFE